MHDLELHPSKYKGESCQRSPLTLAVKLGKYQIDKPTFLASITRRGDPIQARIMTLSEIISNE